jgi:hypothetical protein
MTAHHARLIIGTLLMFGSALPANLLQAGIAVIAANGEPSPTGNGALSLFNAPTLNAYGQTAFVAQLAGTSGGTTDHFALYRSDAGGLTQIVRTGSTVVNGLPMIGFYPAGSWIAADGTVTTIVGAGPAPAQIHNVIGDGGPITMQFPPGSPHPTGNGSLLGVQTATQNDAGVAVFSAIYTGGTPETGLYRRAVDGAISTVVLRNGTAPRGGMMTSFGLGTINEQGQIAARTTVDPGSGGVSSALRIDGSTVIELARQGDVASDGVTTLGGIFSPALAINDAGQIAFYAQYTRPQILGRGVFVADESGLQMVAPAQLPEMVPVINDARVLGITADGDVGFWAEGQGGVDPPSGLYVAAESGPTLVAIEDSLIPSGGKYFRRFLTDAMAYNDNGRMAFLAELSDVVNGAVSGRGLFTYGPEDGLTEIVKAGDSLAGGTVSSVFFYGSNGAVSLQAPDLSLSGLNNLGHVGFGYSLADGAGAGVAIWSLDAAFADADFDEDGHVDGADLAAWTQGFGTESAMRDDGDADSDGDVDGTDFLMWQRQLDSESANPAGSPIPEPAGAILIAWVACFASRRRRLC